MKELFRTTREAVFIAEIGLNHNGSLDCAIEHIDAAADAGADAVKFQTFNAELMNSPYTGSLLAGAGCSTADFEIISFFKSLELSEGDFRRLKKHADEKGILFFSAPFDIDSLSMLEDLGVELYKLASSEMTNIDLITAVGRTQKPVILSTGMANEREIEKALSILSTEGNSSVLLMHCVSRYPCESEYINLRRIGKLKERYSREIGLSDHTSGNIAAISAAALGCRFFEKHFMVHKDHECPDRSLSLHPQEFSQLIESVEEAILMTGTGHIDNDRCEKDIAQAARRSLFVKAELKKGDVLTGENLVALRPGVGISPVEKDAIIGKKVLVDIEAGHCLFPEHVEGFGD